MKFGIATLILRDTVIHIIVLCFFTYPYVLPHGGTPGAEDPAGPPPRSDGEESPAHRPIERKHVISQKLHLLSKCHR